jgi:hypothetical protein
MAVQQVAASTAGHSPTEQDRLKTRRLLRSHNLPYGILPIFFVTYSAGVQPVFGCYHAVVRYCPKSGHAFFRH